MDNAEHTTQNSDGRHLRLRQIDGYRASGHPTEFTKTRSRRSADDTVLIVTEQCFCG